MPLHDWTGRAGWEGMHHLWIAELLRWVKPRLPSDYRAFIGTAPVLAVGGPPVRPDVSVREWPVEPSEPYGERVRSFPTEENTIEPDVEVAVASIEPGTALFVERRGRLVAAVELVSPRNKDRPVARDSSTSRFAGYLLEGVHLLLIDVHPRPSGFSFADRIAGALGLEQPPIASPFAVSYRVGEPAATGGSLLAVWRRPLEVGAALPILPLPLTVESAVTVDLEATYTRAADDAYLS